MDQLVEGLCCVRLHSCLHTSQSTIQKDIVHPPAKHTRDRDALSALHVGPLQTQLPRTEQTAYAPQITPAMI
jgi:hypothetical protein